MLLVIGPLCGLGLVEAFEVGLVGVTSFFNQLISLKLGEIS